MNSILKVFFYRASRSSPVLYTDRVFSPSQVMLLSYSNRALGKGQIPFTNQIQMNNYTITAPFFNVDDFALLNSSVIDFTSIPHANLSRTISPKHSLHCEKQGDLLFRHGTASLVPVFSLQCPGCVNKLGKYRNYNFNFWTFRSTRRADVGPQDLYPQAGFLFGDPASRPVSLREDVSCFSLDTICSVFGTVRDTLLGVETLESKSFVSRFITTKDSEDFVIKLVEDLLILIHGIFNSKGAYDRHIALITYIKLRGSPIDFSATALIANQIFSFVFSSPDLKVQNDDYFESARTWIDSYDRVKKLPIFRKTYKFCMFLLSKGICDKLGLDFDFFKYTKLEKAAIEKDFSSTPNMIHCLLDTVLFYCETGVQCFKTGSIQPIFHSGTAYEKWFDECARLKRLALHSCNLEPHGTTLFEFISDLKSAIEKGTAIRKFGVLDDTEKKMVAAILDALQKIDAELLTRRKAMEERASPFSLLIHGSTSVGKSSFKELCYYHYGRVMSLPLGEEYKYTRSPGAEYWDNFKSSMWCTIVDDAGYKNPTCKEDPSVMELIQMINNVAYVPNQADLPDKGRTPFLCKLVMATTNTMHLNAFAYYSCPVAVARRFPFVIDLSLKSEFADDQGMVNVKKMPAPSESSYPDFWHIRILKPVKAKGNNFNHALVKEFDSIYTFLNWYTEVIRAHESSQINAMETNKKMVTIPTCEYCFLPHMHCECLFPGVKEKRAEDESVWKGLEEKLGVSRKAVESHGFTKALEYALENGTPDLIRATLLDFESESDCSEEYQVQSSESYSWWFDYVKEQKDKFALNAKSFYESLLEDASIWLCPKCIARYDHHCEYLQTEVIFEEGQLVYNKEEKDLVVIKQESVWYQFKVWIFLRIVGLLSWSWICALIVGFFFGDSWKFKLARKLFSQWQTGRVLMRMFGHRFEARVGYTPLVLKLAAGAFAGVALHRLGKFVCSHFLGGEDDDPNGLSRKQYDLKTHVCAKWGCDCEMVNEEDLQGGRLSIDPQNVMSTLRATNGVGSAPIPSGTVIEKPYYFNDPFVACTLDISQQSRCATTEESEATIQRKVLNNLATFFSCQTPPGGERAHRVGVGMNIAMHVWMTNGHNLPPCPFYLTVKRSPQTGCVTNSLQDILVTKSMVRRIPDLDLAFINLRCLPPGKSLVSYFPGPDLEGAFNGTYLSRDKGGNEVRIPVRNITAYQKTFSCTTRSGESIIYNGKSWQGKVEVDTSYGDCGSPLVVRCKGGTLILGIHLLGGVKKTVVTISPPKDIIETVLRTFTPTVFESNVVPISGPSCPREVGPLHSKSPVLFTQGGFANVFGSFKGFRPVGKSKVVRTIICNSMVKRGFKVEYGAPHMGYMPFWHALGDMTHPNVLMDCDILEECKEAYLNDIFLKLSDSELSQVKVFDEDTAINGVAGVQYCDKMNRNTSVGAPYKSTKRHFLEPIECGQGEDRVRFNAEISQRIDEVHEAYRNKRMFHPQFCGQQKDEPIKHKKIEAKKTRIFCMAEAAWSVTVRMYFLSLVMLIQRNPYIFESCPGAIAQSLEWERMWEHLTQFGGENMVAGDFEKFDKRMAATLILLAFDILIEIAKKAGFSEGDLEMMRGVALDTAFAFVDFNGDLIQFFGSNPSGHPLTVIINCIVHSLYMRYCYFVLHRDAGAHARYGLDHFQDYVALLTYGDDGVSGVSGSIKWFNHTAIQRVLKSVGIGYTMADKDAVSVPFISMNECTFLKRSWRYDSGVGAFLAPLDEGSIVKSLTMCVSKSTISQEVRDVAAIATAVREYFFYGEAIFNQKKDMFKEIVEENNLGDFVQESTFPTWDECYTAFWDNSKHVKLLKRTPPQLE